MRSWREDDLEPFCAINSDPAVMATLGPLMSQSEVAGLIERMQRIEAENGYTAWVLERREDGRLIGWCGLIPGTFEPILGKTEIGWRTARNCWGRGYVSEAARAAADWFFVNRDDASLWAITSTGNARSRAVMERLVMSYRPDLDFDHPRIAAGDPLSKHITYELPREDWQPV